MKTIVTGTVVLLTAALSAGPVAAWSSANRYGGSTSHSYGSTSHTNAWGGSSSHTYGQGTEHTNAYGGSTSHDYGGGTTHTNVYGARKGWAQVPTAPRVPEAIHATPRHHPGKAQRRNHDADRRR